MKKNTKPAVESNKQRQSKSGSKKGNREVRVVQVNGAAPVPGIPARTVGIDLGNRYCYWKQIDADGGESEGRVRTEELAEYLGRLATSRVVMETGGHSRWAAWRAIECGHETYVANARHTRAIYENPAKDDPTDAEMLARMGRFDLKLLHPVQLRSAEVQQDLAVVRARDQVVQARSKLIACARELVKATGLRLPACDADYFHLHAAPAVPESMRAAVKPLLTMIARLTATIRSYDKRLERLAEQKYPETALLRQVDSVGPVTSLAYRLTIADPWRFSSSRAVGPYVGLTRKKDKSGDDDPELGISKAGDAYLRRLLIGSAQHTLGPFGKDSDLRRFGLRLMGCAPGQTPAKGQTNKGKKKRAVAAVARKLAVLLHALWTSGEQYEPLRNSRAHENKVGAQTT